MSTLSFPWTILERGTGQGQVPVLIFPSLLLLTVTIRHFSSVTVSAYSSSCSVSPTFTWTVMSHGRQYAEKRVELLLEEHLLPKTPVMAVVH